MKSVSIEIPKGDAPRTALGTRVINDDTGEVVYATSCCLNLTPEGVMVAKVEIPVSNVRQIDADE